jgi:hypothetical protein
MFEVDDPDYTLPKKGDKFIIPIINDTEIYSYSRINDYKGEFNDGYYFVMITGYKNATLILLEELLNSNESLAIDSLMFPLLFNFRHYLELSLKFCIRLKRIYRNQATFEEIGFESVHYLQQLWEEIEVDLTPDVSHNPDKVQFFEALQVTSLIISEIDSLDKNSFAFRYPFNKVDKKNPEPQLALKKIDIDIRNLKSIVLRLIVQINVIEGFYSDKVEDILMKKAIEKFRK